MMMLLLIIMIIVIIINISIAVVSAIKFSHKQTVRHLLKLYAHCAVSKIPALKSQLFIHFSKHWLVLALDQKNK